MTELSTDRLLQVWDIGEAQHPYRRALSLLEAAWPAIGQASFATASIGERDASLLSLREQLFGPLLTGVGRCPSCDVSVELDFLVSDIRGPGPYRHEMAAPANRSLEVVTDGVRVRFRLPDTMDLLSTAPGADEVHGILRRCLISIEGGVGDDVPELTGTIEQAMVERMEEADPQGHVQLSLSCPACDHQWLEPFDILPYLWLEIDDWARRTLREIHLLATAYGWSERAILALSPRRRRQYLAMVLS